MKKLAIDINIDPFLNRDKFANLDNATALALLQKNIKVVLAYINIKDMDYQGMVDEKRVLSGLFLALANIIKLTIIRVDLPEKETTKLLNIYNLVYKNSTSETSTLAELVSPSVKDLNTKASKIKSFVNAIEGFWAKFPKKTDTIVVGKIRIHFGTLNTKPEEKEMFGEGIRQAIAYAQTSKIPHFSAAFYGDVYIMQTLGRSLGQFSKAEDSIKLTIDLKDTSVRKITQAFLHEVCHRFYSLVLNQDEKDDWGQLYKYTLLNYKKDRDLPQIGDSIYFQYGITFSEGDKKTVPGKDLIHKIDISKYPPEYHTNYNEGSDCILSWAELNQRGLFPTTYSVRNAEEFFCEVFSLYYTNDLKEPLKTYFETEINNKFVTPYQTHKKVTK